LVTLDVIASDICATSIDHTFSPWWRSELFGSGCNLFVAKEEYLRMNWLRRTPAGIMEEIDSTDYNQQNYDVCLRKIAILFPVGRQFARFLSLFHIQNKQ
jgi:hypothetical protein